MRFVEYITTKKYKKKNSNTEKRKNWKKEKKRTPYIYKACASKKYLL